MTESLVLQERVGRLVAETMNVQVPSTEADLFESGVLDSLGFVDLLARLEQEFAIKISIEDIEVENFRCVEKIAHFVAQQRVAARN